jgi:hypothetical protein
MARVTVIRPLLFAALVAALGACTNMPPPRPVFPELRFTAEPPIPLDARRIEIVPSYRPGGGPTHVEERPPLALPHVAETWARDRLRAVGARGTVVATITDASVTETALPKEEGFKATFTRQIDTRYDASVAITVVLRDERGVMLRSATARAERSRTTVEGTTLDERDRLLYQLETELMADLDRELETQIRDHFGFYVR